MSMAKPLGRKAGEGLGILPRGAGGGGGGAPGTAQYQAFGTLTPGTVVGLRADGTVDVINGSPGATAFSDPVTVSTVTNINSNIRAVYLSAIQKVAVIYKRGGAYASGQIVVGTVTGDTIVFGSPVNLGVLANGNHSGMSQFGISYAPGINTLFVMSIRELYDASTGTIRYVELSAVIVGADGSVSQGSVVKVGGGGSAPWAPYHNSQASWIRLETFWVPTINRVVAAVSLMSPSGNNDSLFFRRYAVSGTTLTEEWSSSISLHTWAPYGYVTSGMVLAFNGTNLYAYFCRREVADGPHFLKRYRLGLGADGVYSEEAVGPAVGYGGWDTTRGFNVIYYPAIAKFVYFYDSSGGYIQVEGGTATLAHSSAVYPVMVDGELHVFYQSGGVKLAKVLVSGTTVTLGAPVALSAATTSNIDVAYDASAQDFVCANSVSSSLVEAVVSGDLAAPTLNGVVGIARDANGLVTVPGGVADGLSGLTADAKYYATPAGDLTTTAANNRFIGTALTTTSLKVEA